LLASLAETGRGYGIADARPVEPDRWLEEGDTVSVGDVDIRRTALSGAFAREHRLCLAAGRGRKQGFALVGDVLFAGSVGRTDLPGGNQETLIDAIRGKLLVLPDDTAFLPGHGPASTIGTERRSNPYLV
jgi:glyoxylase-like metal-dependent hydrolase (beta-lactamase superfamily II)